MTLQDRGRKKPLTNFLWSCLLVIGCIGLMFLTGCLSKAADTSKVNSLAEFSANEFIMNTLIKITLYAPDEKQGEAALAAAFAEFHRVHQLSDRFALKNLNDPMISDVYRINKEAGIEPVKVSDDILKMLAESRHFYHLSAGAFDPAIGPVVDLWGFGTDEKRVPEAEELNKELTNVDFDAVIIDETQKTVFLPYQGMSLDLGGVAKGYATDMAMEKLRQLGIKHALINAGGNIYALGAKPDGQPWRIGIQDPRAENQVWGILSVQDQAVVSSGDYERYFIEDDVRYHHILDPATGYPATGLMGTTVLIDQATQADILSTAIFVLGSDKGQALIKDIPASSAIFVDIQGQITYSQALEDVLEVVNDADYQLIGSF